MPQRHTAKLVADPAGYTLSVDEVDGERVFEACWFDGHEADELQEVCQAVARLYGLTHIDQSDA